jgi:hypothetical protein
VHFFPFSGSVAAPYGTECRLTLFGSGVVERSVLLEGARLGQPDGLRLEDAFPEVGAHAEGALLGLQIDLESTQQRIDLSASGCFVEFLRPGGGAAGALRFRPLRMTAESSGVGTKDGEVAAPCVVVADRFQTTSLVVVNRSAEPVIPFVRRPEVGAASRQGGVNPASVALPSVAPRAVVEFEFDVATFGPAAEQECSWGRCTTRALDVGPPSPGVAYFTLGRELEQRRLTCVSAL